MKPEPHTASARRINAIAEIVGAEHYLEIGVRKGKTFINVNINDKVAVDPNFAFDITSRPPNERYYAITSDEYFLKHVGDRIFDIVFLDGMHTFEQTLRDFCNSIMLAHKRTVWLLDDTVPSDAYSAWPNQNDATRTRRADFGPGHTSWNGDVFKVLFAIHDFFPRVSYRTIMTGGRCQTVVWAQPRNDFEPMFNNLERISRLTYFDFKNSQTILRGKTEAEVIDEVAAFFGRRLSTSNMAEAKGMLSSTKSDGLAPSASEAGNEGRGVAKTARAF